MQASNAEDVVAGRSTDAASAEEFESGLRGAWRKLTQALTPGWMTPRTRGLGLLWLLVALCATNWCIPIPHYVLPLDKRACMGSVHLQCIASCAILQLCSAAASSQSSSDTQPQHETFTLLYS